MINLIVLHSGNPQWKSCQTAIDVAKEMKKKFNDAIDLKIYTHDSPEARNYELKSATSVFVNNQFVHLDTALSSEEMESFLKHIINISL